MSWLCLALDVAAAEAEALSDFFDTAGAAAVTLRDAGDAPVFEPAPDTTPLWPKARLEALYPLDTDLAAVRAALEEYFARRALPMPGIEARFIEAEDWSTTWRKFSGPIDFGTRLRVAARDAPEVDGRITLRLDPGLAFGTGTHATTALCLEWIAQQRMNGRTVIDYGCGSGVLGIAALLLGAAHVTAVDHDPQARLATAENAAYNGFHAARMRVVGTDAANDAPADIVIANILADPLVELAPALMALLKKDGVIVLSGMRASQWPAVEIAYPAVTFARSCERDGWIAVEGIKTGG